MYEIHTCMKFILVSAGVSGPAPAKTLHDCEQWRLGTWSSFFVAGSVGKTTTELLTFPNFYLEVRVALTKRGLLQVRQRSFLP